MKRTETGLQGRVFVNQQDIKTKKNKFGADGIKHGRKDDFKRKKEDKNQTKRKRDTKNEREPFKPHMKKKARKD